MYYSRTVTEHIDPDGRFFGEIATEEWKQGDREPTVQIKNYSQPIYLSRPKRSSLRRRVGEMESLGGRLSNLRLENSSTKRVLFQDEQKKEKKRREQKLSDKIVNAIYDSSQVLVLYSAKWCAPCQKLKKKLSESPYKEALSSIPYFVLDISVEEDEQMAKEIFSTFSMKEPDSVPRLLLFRNGRFDKFLKSENLMGELLQ